MPRLLMAGYKRSCDPLCDKQHLVKRKTMRVTNLFLNTFYIQLQWHTIIYNKESMHCTQIHRLTVSVDTTV